MENEELETPSLEQLCSLTPRLRTAMERPFVKAPLSAGVSSWLLLEEEPKTTDEAGRFDDESLCYSRVAPVARHRAA